jgi:hypothetical protein
MTRSRRSRGPSAADHLPLDHLDLVDVTFHGGGAAERGVPGGDGFLVAAEAVGERAELGRLAGLGPGEAAFEFGLTLAERHDLGDGAEMGRGCPGAGTARPSGIEPRLVHAVETVRMGEQPASTDALKLRNMAESFRLAKRLGPRL